MELVAGELDGEHVVRLVAEHRVQQGHPDVADGGRAQACRFEDRREHPHGRRLAVGAGDREPGCCFSAVTAPQPPGEFDVAPDGDVRIGGGQEEWLAGLPAGGRDHQLGGLGQGVAVAEAHGDPERLQLRRLGAGALVVAVVDDGDEGSPRVQGAGCGDTADAEPGHRDALAPPVHVAHFLAAHPA